MDTIDFQYCVVHQNSDYCFQQTIFYEELEDKSFKDSKHEKNNTKKEKEELPVLI